MAAINLDDDEAGILVSATSGPSTDERGGPVTFNVVLTSRPAADVTIELAPSRPGEGVPSTTRLVFTPADWDVPRLVTVRGLDDDADDGDQPYAIVLSPAASADPLYDGLDPADVSLMNLDDDRAGLIFMPLTDLVTTEAGGVGRFSVSLATRPTAVVVVTLMTTEAGEAMLSSTRLVFTPETL